MGSSTCEPTWGSNRPNTLDTDLHLWESINIPSSLSPTVYYRECEKCTSYILTSTKVFHSASTFTCVPCLDEDKTPNQTPTKRNPYAHETRDDEQEYGRISIPMSDDSSDDCMFDDDMSEPSKENKSDTFINCVNKIILPTDQDATNIDHIATVDMAFTLGPVRDGIILNHQLSPIPIHSNP
jgi:hypothetical protein